MRICAGSKKEFEYSIDDFNAVRKRLKQVTGISLADSKDSMVYSRLVRRIRKLKLLNFSDYLRHIESDEAESELFINALTTNLTSFFREKHHFDFLKQYLSKNKEPIKIWCTASSTGQEPYSIAMAAVETLGSFNIPISVIASDINSEVLNSAARGIYSLSDVEDLPISIKRQFFQKGKGTNADKVKIVPELRRLVSFKKLNLMDDSYDMPSNFDIVFCRNVMIYFDKETQLEILQKILRHLKNDGIYIAGHSENFAHVSQLLVPMGQTIYRPKGM